MDAKNDDSAGSDSLDKSLQKKCVVDDVGQGEGLTGANAALAQGISDINVKQKSDTEVENRPAISINLQNKTEKSAGDGICDDIVENNYRIDSNNMDGLDIMNDKTKNTTQKMVSYETPNVNNNAEENKSLCAHSNDSTDISNQFVNDVDEAPSESSTNNRSNSNCSSSSNSNSNSNSSNAFESKVKQISKNLKETTLAENANKKTITSSAEDTNSTSSASSASSASSTPECEQATVDAATAALYSLGPSTSAAAAAAAAAASGCSTSVQDEHDHRSKKVRFHPDVKENDGGNRIIPKKKKKLKTTQGGANTSSGGDESSGNNQRGASAEDDMELDEEDDVEGEGIFSIAKTIEDAQDYLKEHPLTFAGSFDKTNVTTQSGLLEEEDLPQLADVVEDDEEEMQSEVLPENGVACILGKQIKCGKVEFLLRYIDRPGLYWETEEFISQRCPNLLNQYEHCRERRQARLMNFVAKRQNLRQRYTDF